MKKTQKFELPKETILKVIENGTHGLSYNAYRVIQSGLPNAKWYTSNRDVYQEILKYAKDDKTPVEAISNEPETYQILEKMISDILKNQGKGKTK